MRARGWILSLLWLCACGDGGGGGSVAFELIPGQTVNGELPIDVDVDGGELLSCDLAALVRSDAETTAALTELDVELGQLTQDGPRTCAIAFLATARPAAAAGEYRLVTKLFYSFRGAFGIDTSAVNGSIRITVRG